MAKRSPLTTIKGTAKRWSFSSWKCLQQCAYKFGKLHVEGFKPKDETGGSQYIERGNAVHKKAELYLKGELTGPPPYDLRKLEYEFKQLKKLRPWVEEYWNVDERFQLTRPYGGVMVLKADAALPPSKNACAIAIDHKTGRIYEDDHDKQAELSALVTKAKFTESDGVDFEFWYVDIGEVQPYHFTEKKLDALREYWMEQGQIVMTTHKFPATPSIDACKYCPIRTDKGGDCDRYKILGAVLR